jgi:hypothetical protein
VYGAAHALENGWVGIKMLALWTLKGVTLIQLS